MDFAEPRPCQSRHDGNAAMIFFMVFPFLALGCAAFLLDPSRISLPTFARKWNTKLQMRKLLIAANWKMYKTPIESTAFLTSFYPLIKQNTQAEILLCPAMTSLAGL